MSDVIVFNEPASLRGFFEDSHFVRAIRGPVGSGKTSEMCMDIIAKAFRQAPSPRDGVRYSKELVVRTSMKNLKNTAITTWQHWVSARDFGGDFTWGPPATHHLRLDIGPGDLVDLIVIFQSIEGPPDIDDLDGFEVSRAWLNAASESEFEVFTKLCERVNRYPAKRDGGCSEPGVRMDYNSPDADHWLYRMAELQRPANARFYHQPPAMFQDDNGTLVSLDGTRYRVNTEGDAAKNILPADNIENLDARYYEQQVSVRTDDQIKVQLLNQYGFLLDGDPVHPLYSDDRHYAGHDLIAYPGLPLLLGFDCGPGGRPAVAIFQITPKGQMRVLDEIVTDSFTSGPRFIDERVIPHLTNHYPGFQVVIGGERYLARGWGDPAGRAGEGYEETFFDYCKKRKLYIEPTHNHQNLVGDRVKALDTYLKAGIEGGKPAFLLSAKCPMIRAGLAGRYKFSKMKTGANRDALRREPDKNDYCVDLETEALTPEGWRRFDSIAPGDAIMVRDENPRKGPGLRIGEVSAVNVFEGPREVVRLHSSQCEFLFTPAHRHLIRTRNGVTRFVRTTELRQGHMLLEPGAEARNAKQEFFTDRFIELAAWVAAEGTKAPTGEAWVLCQSTTANPRYVEYIDGLTRNDECVIRHSMWSDHGMQTWRIGKERALLLSHYQPGKVPSPEFVMMMSNRQRRKYLYEFMRADGNSSNGCGRDLYMPDKADIVRSRDFFSGSGSHRIFQASRARVDALQMIGSLCGLPVSVRPSADGWVCTIRRPRPIQFHGLQAEGAVTEGVWCPSTSNGTWVMRRAGRVIVTGNSHPCEACEYGALGTLGPQHSVSAQQIAAVSRHNALLRPAQSGVGY